MSKKLEIRVCVGSSCHVRGGTRTLKVLESLISGAALDKKIELKADLCLDNCLEAPNVVVGGVTHGGITPDRAEGFFRDVVLPQVNK